MISREEFDRPSINPESGSHPHGIQTSGLQKPRRQIAITFDDLPAVHSRLATGLMMADLAQRVCSELRRQMIHAVGFVNESRLFKIGDVDDRIDSLRVWVNHGMELGNHTFAHLSLNEVSLEKWKDDVVRGETITSLLQPLPATQRRYFRHPFLDLGVDPQTRENANQFLTGRGYRLAPVTIDTWDWLYGEIYDVALRNNNTPLLKHLRDTFLRYLGAVCSYYESVSSALVGYQIRQILLLHANQFTAAHLGSVIDVLRERGYEFISLAEALDDSVYQLSDDYFGRVGISWLDRWAISHKLPEQISPALPSWLLDQYNSMEIGVPIVKRWFRPPTDT